MKGEKVESMYSLRPNDIPIEVINPLDWRGSHSIIHLVM